MNPPDHYRVLGVGRDASEEEIKAAFREAILRLHPDKRTSHKHAASLDNSDEYLSVQEARKILGDAESRREYDQELTKAASLADVHISDVVRLSSMFSCAEGSPGAACLSWPCRCGGSYFLDVDTGISGSTDDHVVQCSTCSLYIQIESDTLPDR